MFFFKQTAQIHSLLVEASFAAALVPKLNKIRSEVLSKTPFVGTLPNPDEPNAKAPLVGIKESLEALIPKIDTSTVYFFARFLNRTSSLPAYLTRMLSISPKVLAGL